GGPPQKSPPRGKRWTPPYPRPATATFPPGPRTAAPRGPATAAPPRGPVAARQASAVLAVTVNKATPMQNVRADFIASSQWLGYSAPPSSPTQLWGDRLSAHPAVAGTQTQHRRDYY